MSTSKEFLFAGVTGLAAISDPLLAPFILLAAGIIFILWRI